MRQLVTFHASTARKLLVTDAQLDASFHYVGTPAYGMMHPHLGQTVPPQLIKKITQSCALKLVWVQNHKSHLKGDKVSFIVKPNMHDCVLGT